MLLAGVCSLSNVIGVLILVLFSSTASFTKAQQQQQQQVNLFCQSGFCVNSVLVNVTNTELQIIFSGGDNWSWFGIGLGGDSMATASTMFILCNTEHTVTAAQRTSLGYIEPRVISKPDFQFIIDHDKSGFTLKLGKSSTQLLQTSSSILWAVGASTTTATTANVLDASQTGLPIHASKGVVVNPLLLIVSSDSISNTTSHIISHDKLLSSSSTAFASNSSISSSMTTTTSTDPQPPQLPPYPSPSNLFDSSSVLDNHPPSCANNPLSIRNEWRELSHEDRILFIEAVKCLMNTSSTSQWTPSNGSLYDDFVQHHNKVARQVHFTPMFIVFHRIFIIAYENALRTCGSGGVGEKGKFAHITLPYWDVSLDSDEPTKSILLQRQYFGGDGVETKDYCVLDGPFANRSCVVPKPHCLRRNIDKTEFFKNGKAEYVIGSQFSPKMLEFASQMSSGEGRRFDYFRDMMESTVHEAVHFGIGGAKGDMSKADTAPNDPIFWLHHSNIDRIWCEWQELLPQLSMSYDGKDEKGRAVTTDDLIDLGPLQHFLPSSYWHNRPIRVKDALDYKKWCYSYTRSVVFSWSDQTWIPNTGKTKLEMGCKDQSTLMSKKAAASSFFVNQ